MYNGVFLYESKKRISVAAIIHPPYTNESPLNPDMTNTIYESTPLPQWWLIKGKFG
jgi:hypothetical protein